MRTPTIYDLARLNRDAGLYYFSADTLAFFKQRITDFTVETTVEPGVYFIRAAKRGVWITGMAPMSMVSEAWISARTGKTCSASRGEAIPEYFLEEHRAAEPGEFG